eukprot:CAMPEP_0113582260 /NCGR_PEP_ID=MMETSP0015_2-20120614/31798_1 /TAXON_ID=2838 /ORGANISM="Odontella" /LENGTH=30 /DNA_ID=CAMNT_0000486877 /DNA_START=138 /DNA_END=230 /DNA_ORIENTATION=- /assembly_acc=CAM_ASM_000160
MALPRDSLGDRREGGTRRGRADDAGKAVAE